MKKPSVPVLKKYLTAMNKIKAKYITSERLSRVIGVYPEVIDDNLSYFEPMLKMDASFNLLELVPAMKKFVEDEEEKKVSPIHIIPVRKKEVEQYESLNDFIYQKYSVGGMLDKNAKLTDRDLRVMKKLIAEELSKRKKKQRAA